MIEFRDGQNRWITSGLFTETAASDKYAVYSLEDLRRHFINMRDPTGIRFADEYLGGYAHWKALLASPKVRPFIDEWLEELDVRIQATALSNIATVAEEGNFQANKFLVDKGWKPKRKAGRPTKAEKEAHLAGEKRLEDAVSGFLQPIRH